VFPAAQCEEGRGPKVRERFFPSTQPELHRYLEFCKSELQLEPHQMKVLDFGCGEGNATLEFRRKGYQVVGADIDLRSLNAGREKIAALGMDAKEILFEVGEDGRLPFPDGIFHLVFSQQVFEHVKELGQVTDEIRRVTAPGGWGFHIFSPKFTPQELHFFMPFVHWLPKNGLRRYAIRAYAELGVGMRPPEIPDASPRERAEFLYNYSINQTYYWSYKEVAKAFQQSGLDVCFTVTNHPKLRKLGPLANLLKVKPIRSLVARSILTVRTIHLLTRRPRSEKEVRTPIRIGEWEDEWRPAFCETGTRAARDKRFSRAAAS